MKSELFSCLKQVRVEENKRGKARTMVKVGNMRSTASLPFFLS
jgi:hypothetical protein